MKIRLPKKPYFGMAYWPKRDGGQFPNQTIFISGQPVLITFTTFSQKYDNTIRSK